MNTTPEGALKVEPESRGCNAWAAVPGGVAARDLDRSPAADDAAYGRGGQEVPRHASQPCVRSPRVGMANKVEVLGRAARRPGLSAEFFGWAAREGLDTNPAQPAQGVCRRNLHGGNRGTRKPGVRRQYNGLTPRRDGDHYGEQHATTGRGPLPLAADGVSARPHQRPRPKGSARRLQPLARPLTATRGHHHQRRLGCTRQQGACQQSRVTRALAPGLGWASIPAGAVVHSFTPLASSACSLRSRSATARLARSDSRSSS